MQGATPCLLARYSHIPNSWIFVQNTVSRSHDFICFQPQKKLFHSDSIWARFFYCSSFGLKFYTLGKEHSIKLYG